MTLFSSSAAPGEAKLRYLDADIEILRAGRFVVCAVTGRRIPLEELRYWSVDLQEAYADADAALARWRQLQGGGSPEVRSDQGPEQGEST